MATDMVAADVPTPELQEELTAAVDVPTTELQVEAPAAADVPTSELQVEAPAAADVPTPETPAAVDVPTPELQVEAPAAVDKQPHRLHRKWTFWYDNQSKPKQGAAWGSSLRKGYTFDTVEEFWCLYDQIFKPSKYPANADFHLFRDGVEPKWEDPECAYGGKWTVSSSKNTNLDTIWLETLMALIGEQFDDAEEICGVVASVRQRQDKISLWTKTAANESAQNAIGRKWKEIIDVNDKISYNFHDDSKRERSAKIRYSV